MRDDEDMLAKHLTPYTFGAFTPEAIEAWKTNVRGIDKVKPLVIFSKVRSVIRDIGVVPSWERLA